MRTTIKFLFVLICLAVISGVSAPALAANTPNYTLAIPCQFDGSDYGSAHEFHNGLAAVQDGGKYGFIDKAGNVVVPFEYDVINSISVNYSIVSQRGKGYGVLDKNGKLVIPCKYGYISVNDDAGIAIVGKGTLISHGGETHVEGLCGFADLKTGKEILPFTYKYIFQSNDYSNMVYIVSLDYKVGVIDRTGKFIVPMGTYDNISLFYPGFAFVEKNRRYGVINETGKVVVPVVYDFYGAINGLIHASKGNKHGILNTSGKIVVPFRYDGGKVYDNGAIYMTQNSKTTIFDRTGKVIAPAGKYDRIHSATGNLIYVERGGKVGAIDMTGKEIVPFIYIEAETIKNGLTEVVDNDKSAVINQNGKVILPLDKYGYIQGLDSDRYFHIRTLNDKCILKDYDGNTVLPGEYDYIGDINDGYIVVRNQEEYAVLNKDGDIIVPFREFDYIAPRISENMVAVRKDGLTGYINLPEYVTLAEQ